MTTPVTTTIATPVTTTTTTEITAIHAQRLTQHAAIETTHSDSYGNSTMI